MGPDGAIYIADLYEQRIDHSSHYAGRITNPGARFYGFDSFEGLPEQWDDVRHALEEGGATRVASVPMVMARLGKIDGRRVSHVVDPRTGSSVPGAVEAVVVADAAGRADAWSTALLVLGAQRSTMSLVERAGLDAYVFDAAGRIVETPGFEALEVE